MLHRRHWLQAALCGSTPALWSCGGTHVAATPGATPVRLPASGRTEVPLIDDDPHVTVELQVNGQPLRFALDTGADHTIVGARAAAALGLSLSGTPVPGSGAGGPVAALHATTLPQLVIGQAQWSNEPAYVMPLPEGLAWDGLLGAPLFRAVVATLDYAALRLTLDDPLRFAAPPQARRLPLQRHTSGKLLVPAEAAGHAGWFSLDTGAHQALTLFTPTVERLGLRHRLGPGRRMITGSSPGGDTLGDLVRLPQLRLGPWTLPQVVTELSLAQAGLFASDAWMGNLGAEVWRRFTVTLDMPQGGLYLAPNGRLQDDFPAPRSGLYLRVVDGRAVVIEVLPDSPAADAGVPLHSVVLAVDGQGLEGGPWGRLRAALRQPPGRRVGLQLRTPDGRLHAATLVLRDLV